jgi:hypothetical protein
VLHIRDILFVHSLFLWFFFFSLHLFIIFSISYVPDKIFCFHNEKNISVCTHKNAGQIFLVWKPCKKIMNDRRQPIYQKYTRYIQIEFTHADQWSIGSKNTKETKNKCNNPKTTNNRFLRILKLKLYITCIQL